MRERDEWPGTQDYEYGVVNDSNSTAIPPFEYRRTSSLPLDLSSHAVWSDNQVEEVSDDAHTVGTTCCSDRSDPPQGTSRPRGRGAEGLLYILYILQYPVF